MNNELNELRKEIAMLKDGYGYQKDMVDLYAKKLKEVWNYFDDVIDGDKKISLSDLKNLKNSIPESALLRAK